MKKTKCFNFPTASILMLMLGLAMSGNARAQVTIGENLEPQSFSILELISNNTKGLRLPQMTTAERDAMVLTPAFDLEKKGKARGLQIFNLTTRCVETWNGTKWIEVCAPVFLFPANISHVINITTFVNVMYDFQYQEMYAYNTGTPVSYQWFAKRVGQADTEYKAISGAESADYTIPVNFVKDVYQPMVNDSDTDYNDNIRFTCAAEYADGTFGCGSIDILFIGTNTSGYGTDANGVRYLTLDMGSGGQTVPDGSTAKVKVALLNLGQSADWTPTGGYVSNNNAADLGDFYQWGRVADGHQNIVWSKNASHVNQILPCGETPGKTSEVMDYNSSSTTAPAYDTQTHQVVAGNEYYGKVIFSFSTYNQQDWYYYNNAHDPGLWGANLSSFSRTYEGTLNFPWDKPANNPCPSGWRIPAIWSWWDILIGNGSDDPHSSSISAINNTWQLRSHNNTVYGGYIVTNYANEKIFLPITGIRGAPDCSNPTYGNFGSFYLSSTSDSNKSGAMNSMLNITRTGYLYVNNTPNQQGQCARCFKEP